MRIDYLLWLVGGRMSLMQRIASEHPTAAATPAPAGIQIRPDGTRILRLGDGDGDGIGQLKQFLSARM